MTIEKLEALERAATPFPWSEWHGNTSVHFGRRIEQNDRCTLVGADGVVCKCDNMDSDCNRQAVKDAEFIATSRNALPSLLAVAKAAKCYTNAAPMVRGEAYRDLCEAIAQLEATP